MHRSFATCLAIILSVSLSAFAGETPKRGGTLTFMIPADFSPSFDGHRENTFATIHAVGPFYSVLIRANPENPADTTEFVCDVCTEIPRPTDGGRTYAFQMRGDVRFQDGSLMTAEDVVASWNSIVDPPEGVISVRRGYYSMVDRIEAPDAKTVVFHLKFATAAFLPALADPYAFIYKKEILDRDPRWYEKNIMGSGPFRFKEYQAGQSISGVRNPDYYRPGTALSGWLHRHLRRQAGGPGRCDQALTGRRSNSAAFRRQRATSLWPRSATRSPCRRATGIAGRWSRRTMQRKPFDDVRVRRALTLAIDRWHGAAPMSRITLQRTVGGIVFPGSPLAANKEELEQLAGLLAGHREVARGGEAAAEGSRRRGADLRAAQSQYRSAIQVQWHLGHRRMAQDRRAGDPACGADRTRTKMRCAEAISRWRSTPSARTSSIRCSTAPSTCRSSVSDANYGNYDDPTEIEIYDRMLREPDFAQQRDLMRQLEKRVLDTEAHEAFLLWRYRIVPYRSYVKGWKISPSHYVNQDLATVWLDK